MRHKPPIAMPDQPESVRDAHFRQMNAYRGDPAYARLGGYADRAVFFEKQIGRRWEIDTAIYDEFLDMLPPMGWRGDSFYMSEFTFGDITHKFSREGDRYFCEVAPYPPRPVAQSTTAGPAPEPKG